MKIPLYHPQRTDADVELDLDSVVRSGRYVDGPERDAFEDEFAAYLGVKHVVTVASGTDALEAALRYLGTPDDRVAVPGNTFRGTMSAIWNAGLRPQPVDVDANGLMLEREVDVSGSVPVDLCGHRCPTYPPQGWVVRDACQSLWPRPTPVCYSFHPTKPLGTYGTGGVVATDDKGMAEYVRRWRWHGMGGRNSRLSELQAHVLRRRLPFMDEHTAARQRIAEIYQGELHLDVTRPEMSHWHTFPVKVHVAAARPLLAAALKASGIETKPAYDALSLHPGVQDWANRVLYLPIWPGMRDEEIEYVVRACNDWRAEC